MWFVCLFVCLCVLFVAVLDVELHPRGVPTGQQPRGFQEYCWRLLFRHPSIQRIAKQLNQL